MVDLSKHCATSCNEVVVAEFPNMVQPFPPLAGLEKVMSTSTAVVNAPPVAESPS